MNSSTERRQTLKTLKRLEAIEDGAKFHAAMARLSSQTLRKILRFPGSGRFHAGCWADDFLPAAVAREAAKGPQAPKGARGFVARIRKDIGDEAAQEAAPWTDLADAAQAAMPMSLGAARKLAKLLKKGTVAGLTETAQAAALVTVEDMLAEWDTWTEKF